MSKEQKQALINMVKADEDLGLYRREAIAREIRLVIWDVLKYNDKPDPNDIMKPTGDIIDRKAYDLAIQIEELFKPK